MPDQPVAPVPHTGILPPPGAEWGFIILIALLLIPAIFFIIQALRAPDDPELVRRKAALQALEDRYARGEVSRAEYQREKNELQNY